MGVRARETTHELPGLQHEPALLAGGGDGDSFAVPAAAQRSFGMPQRDSVPPGPCELLRPEQPLDFAACLHGAAPPAAPDATPRSPPLAMPAADLGEMGWMGPPHSSLFPSPNSRRTQWAAQPWPADDRPVVAPRDFSAGSYLHHATRNESRPRSELFSAMAADDALLEEIVGGGALSVSALGELLEARRSTRLQPGAPEERWGLDAGLDGMDLR